MYRCLPSVHCGLHACGSAMVHSKAYGTKIGAPVQSTIVLSSRGSTSGIFGMRMAWYRRTRKITPKKAWVMRGREGRFMNKIIACCDERFLVIGFWFASDARGFL